jgi:large subunit ribosomal protein L29
MSFSKIAELRNLDLETRDKSIIELSKELVDLKIKKATRQAFKPHEFKHKKRLRAQQLTLQNLKK